MNWITGLAAAALTLAAGFPAQAAADAQKGQALVQMRCAVCHAVTPDAARRPGPSLYGVFGRKAGSSPGFAYSKALQTSKITWNAAQLDQYLAAPGKKAPGTLMMVSVSNAAERADIVAYLASLRKKK